MAHTYAQPGPYYVTLIATNCEGQGLTTFQRLIRINAQLLYLPLVIRQY